MKLQYVLVLLTLIINSSDCLAMNDCFRRWLGATNELKQQIGSILQNNKKGISLENSILDIESLDTIHRILLTEVSDDFSDAKFTDVIEYFSLTTNTSELEFKILKTQDDEYYGMDDKGRYVLLDFAAYDKPTDMMGLEEVSYIAMNDGSYKLLFSHKSNKYAVTFNEEGGSFDNKKNAARLAKALGIDELSSPDTDLNNLKIELRQKNKGYDLYVNGHKSNIEFIIGKGVVSLFHIGKLEGSFEAPVVMGENKKSEVLSININKLDLNLYPFLTLNLEILFKTNASLSHSIGEIDASFNTTLTQGILLGVPE